MTLKESILKAVENGSKGVQVVTDAVVMLSEQGWSMDRLLSEASAASLPEVLEQMVKDGEIVEVEYVLPGSNRVKSFYLPKGTDVKVNSSVHQQ